MLCGLAGQRHADVTRPHGQFSFQWHSTSAGTGPVLGFTLLLSVLTGFVFENRARPYRPQS